MCTYVYMYTYVYTTYIHTRVSEQYIGGHLLFCALAESGSSEPCLKAAAPLALGNTQSIIYTMLVTMITIRQTL